MSGSTLTTVLDVAGRVERPRAIESSHQGSSPTQSESPRFQNVLSGRLQQGRPQPTAETANLAEAETTAVEAPMVETPPADENFVFSTPEYVNTNDSKTTPATEAVQSPEVVQERAVIRTEPVVIAPEP